MFEKKIEKRMVLKKRKKKMIEKINEIILLKNK